MENEKKKDIFVLIDTDGLTFEEVKEDLIEMHADTSDDPEEFAKNLSDESVYEHKSFLNECDYDDFCLITLPQLLEQGVLVIKLDVGRWDGRYNAMFVVNNKNDFDKLLSDFDDSKITYNKTDGTLEFVLRDHDGTTSGVAKLVKKEDYNEIEAGYKELLNLFENKSFNIVLKEF